MQNDQQDKHLQNNKPLPAESTLEQTEKDVDDVVHQKPESVPAAAAERDADELVHQQPSKAVADPSKETDPDERVHDTDDASFGSE